MNSTLVVERLYSVVNQLDEIDKILDNLNSDLSECDSLISDYEHFIENGKLDEIDLNILFNNMQDVLLKRRQIKQNMTIRDCFKRESNKLSHSEQRQFLLSSIGKTVKSLDTEYKNRILTDEDIASLKITNKPAKRRRGRPKKDEVK